MAAEHQSSLKQACPAGCSNLRSLPESLGALPALRQLDMGGCTSICQLPESLGDLSTLEWLDLSRCRSLTHLPDSTSRLGESWICREAMYRTRCPTGSSQPTLSE